MEKNLYCFLKQTFDIFTSELFLLCLGWINTLLILVKFSKDGHNSIYTKNLIQRLDAEYIKKIYGLV